MTITNAKVVLLDRIIENGFVSFEGGIIRDIGEGQYCGEDKILDANGAILMPGFIDIHIHGSLGVDFMDANVDDYPRIAKALFSEGVTTFLATTLTSDNQSLKRVCETVKKAKDITPSLGGIHFEGPYICEKYKGAQNPDYIRLPNIEEFDDLNKLSGNNVKYISMAPEKEGSLGFIKHVTNQGVTVSAGHTDASFDDMSNAIKKGLTNTTHTHNAMSGHHHRNPGVVTAAFYFNELYTEFICDTIHVCPDTLKASYKIIGPERFIVITDALKIKHSDLDKFELFGLPCERKNGAAYLLSGPLAGSLLTMNQGMKNIHDICNANLIDLAKITSKNAAKSLHFVDRGEIKEGLLADFVLLDNDFNVIKTFKNGIEVFSRD